MCVYQPPITFQPPPPPGSGTNSSAATVPQQQQPKPAASGPAHPDLITRYNLKDKVDAAAADASNDADNSSSGKGAGKGWSTNRDERQSLLQKRRDQMILEARRKMEAKIAAEKAAAS
jgi:coupling of ubiquitin conjugation to ER degradation protein 1